MKKVAIAYPDRKHLARRVLARRDDGARCAAPAVGRVGRSQVGRQHLRRASTTVVLASGANHGVVSFAKQCGLNLTMRGTVTCQMGQRNQYTETDVPSPAQRPADADGARRVRRLVGDAVRRRRLRVRQAQACGGHVVAYTTITMQDLPNGTQQDEFVSRARVAAVSDRVREQPARRPQRLRYQRLLLQRLLPQPLRQRSQQRGAREGARGARRQLIMRKLALARSVALPSARARRRDRDARSTMPPDRPSARRRRSTKRRRPITDARRHRRATRRRRKWIEPFGAIAGGVRLESLHRAPGEQTGAQNPTVAVSRLGVRGGVGEHITYASEFEAALGGPLGYGASVWEGQAAIAIRDQFVRYTRARLVIRGGSHRRSGELRLRLGARRRSALHRSLHARPAALLGRRPRQRPVRRATTSASTSRLGAHVPLDEPDRHHRHARSSAASCSRSIGRSILASAAQVGNNQNNLPDQNLHIYFGSPSVMRALQQLRGAEPRSRSTARHAASRSWTTRRSAATTCGSARRRWFDTAVGKRDARSRTCRATRTRSSIRSTRSIGCRICSRRTRCRRASTSTTRSTTASAFSTRWSTRASPIMHVRQHYLNLGDDVLDRGLARDRRARLGVRAADQRRDDDDGQPLAVRDRAAAAELTQVA